MTEEERKRYEKYLMNFVRDKDVLNTARVEGKIEGKIEIALAMIVEGETNEKIKKYTKLTDEQINELRRKLNNND
jgi:hypothetical protein